MEAESAGRRLYLVRLACGDGLRKAESMADFVDRVRKVTGEVYDPSTISMLERELQGWRLKDLKTFAAVDPLRRGWPWLGGDGIGQPALELAEAVAAFIGELPTPIARARAVFLEAKAASATDLEPPAPLVTSPNDTLAVTPAEAQAYVDEVAQAKDRLTRKVEKRGVRRKRPKKKGRGG